MNQAHIFLLVFYSNYQSDCGKLRVSLFLKVSYCGQIFSFKDWKKGIKNHGQNIQNIMKCVTISVKLNMQDLQVYKALPSITFAIFIFLDIGRYRGRQTLKSHAIFNVKKEKCSGSKNGKSEEKFQHNFSAIFQKYNYEVEILANRLGTNHKVLDLATITEYVGNYSTIFLCKSIEVIFV